jgi:hypothetical protein
MINGRKKEERNLNKGKERRPPEVRQRVEWEGR